LVALFALGLRSFAGGCLAKGVPIVRSKEMLQSKSSPNLLGSRNRAYVMSPARNLRKNQLPADVFLQSQVGNTYEPPSTGRCRLPPIRNGKAPT